VNPRPWSGAANVEKPDIEPDIRALSDPDSKLRVIFGEWPDQESQRNFTLAHAMVEGFDYGFILDTDEVYDPAQLRAMMAYATAHPDVDCWHMRWHTYWKSLRYVIDPWEDYQPPVFVRLGTCGFVQSRNVLGSAHGLIPPEIGVCHHMSYALADADVRRKLRTFGHAADVLPGWFDSVWLGWDRDRTLANLHPVRPAQYARAVEQPLANLPPVLRELALRHPNYPCGSSPVQPGEESEHPVNPPRVSPGQ
jgi:hypothetical protein